jgi:ubiquinone/menaquinone biosynthesis C-methylase UbiE
MPKDATLDNDYERMVPEFHGDTLIYAEHVTRYLAARELVSGKIVLDIASGSGYGTQILAETAQKVYGVDVNERAVNYSQKHFGGKNIEYLVGDGEKIPLPTHSVDVVITFETIEHIADYKKFVKEIKRVLRPDGLAIVSTPNDIEFAEGNHFHLHEFTYDELVDMLREDFTNIDPYYQGTWKYVAVGTQEVFERSGDIQLRTLNVAPKPPEQQLYFYLVCSNRQITEKIESIAALGEHYSDRKLVEIESTHLQRQKTLEERVDILEKESEHYKEQFKNEHKTRVTLEHDINVIRNTKGYALYVKARKIYRKLRP